MKKNMRALMVFVLAGLGGAALLHVSQLVQQSEDELARIEENITQEKEYMRVLNAEWSYLNRPQNLEALAREYLDLVPPGTEPIMAAPSDLPPAPKNDEGMDGALKPVSMPPVEGGDR